MYVHLNNIFQRTNCLFKILDHISLQNFFRFSFSLSVLLNSFNFENKQSIMNWMFVIEVLDNYTATFWGKSKNKRRTCHKLNLTSVCSQSIKKREKNENYKNPRKYWITKNRTSTYVHTSMHMHWLILHKMLDTLTKKKKKKKKTVSNVITSLSIKTKTRGDHNYTIVIIFRRKKKHRYCLA